MGSHDAISVDISSDVYVNMAPFVHAAFGQEGARAMNKSFVYDVAQAQGLKSYYVCQTAYTHPAVSALKCTSFHGHAGCVNEGASNSYTAAKVITGVLTGGLSLLGFGSGDPQGPNIGSHNKWPQGVYSETGEEIPHCYMATCYDKFRLSKSFDIDIGQEEILSIVRESQPVVVSDGSQERCVLGEVEYQEVKEEGILKRKKRVSVDGNSYDVRDAFESPCKDAIAQYDDATEEAYYDYVVKVADALEGTKPAAFVTSAGHLVNTTMAAYLQRASSKDSDGTTVSIFAETIGKLLSTVDDTTKELTDQETRIKVALTKSDSAGLTTYSKLKELKVAFDQALSAIEALSPFYLLTEEQIENISNGVFCPGLIGYYAVSQ